jgi:hypothetical protein
MFTVDTATLKAGDRIASPYLNPPHWTVTGTPRRFTADDLATELRGVEWAVGSWRVPVTSDQPRNIETRRGYVIRVRDRIEAIPA